MLPPKYIAIPSARDLQGVIYLDSEMPDCTFQPMGLQYIGLRVLLVPFGR